MPRTAMWIDVAVLRTTSDPRPLSRLASYPAPSGSVRPGPAGWRQTRPYRAASDLVLSRVASDPALPGTIRPGPVSGSVRPGPTGQRNTWFFRVASDPAPPCAASDPARLRSTRLGPSSRRSTARNPTTPSRRLLPSATAELTWRLDDRNAFVIPSGNLLVNSFDFASSVVSKSPDFRF